MVVRRREVERHGIRSWRPLWSAWHRQRRRYHGGSSGLGNLGEGTGGFAVDDANRKPSETKRDEGEGVQVDVHPAGSSNKKVHKPAHNTIIDVTLYAIIVPT